MGVTTSYLDIHEVKRIILYVLNKYNTSDIYICLYIYIYILILL